MDIPTPSPPAWALTPAAASLSGGDLLAYHRTRARAYGMIADLLSGEVGRARGLDRRTLEVLAGEPSVAPTGGGLDSGCSGMGLFDPRSVTDLTRWVEEIAGRGCLGCQDPGSDSLAVLHRGLGFGIDGDRRHELRALAEQSDRTVWALRTRSLDVAVNATDVQARYLADHGLACLGALADCLLGADSSSLATSLGKALGRLLVLDGALLAPGADARGQHR